MLISRDTIRIAGELSGTDKVCHHGYERFYADFLNRSEIKNEILEIGYGEGSSVKFWNKLYPNSFLNIIDKDISKVGVGYQVFQCDQSSREELDKVKKQIENKSIDLIVDDGSHIPEHTILTFNVFFGSVLNPGSSYIIEDIETSYWRYTSCYGYKTNYGLFSKKSIVNAFGVLTHWINREFLSNKQRLKIKKRILSLGFDLDTVSLIRSISFGQNCLCITKNTDDDLKFNQRIYRFKEKPELFSRQLFSKRIIEKITPKTIKERITSNPHRKRKIKEILKNLGLIE